MNLKIKETVKLILWECFKNKRVSTYTYSAADKETKFQWQFFIKIEEYLKLVTDTQMREKTNKSQTIKINPTWIFRYPFNRLICISREIVKKTRLLRYQVC